MERIAEPTETGRAAALAVGRSVAAPRLRPAPAWVADRMMRSAPDLHFDVTSRLLKGREHRKLAQAAPAFASLLYDVPDLIIVIEGFEYNDRLALVRADVRPAQRAAVMAGGELR